VKKYIGIIFVMILFQQHAEGKTWIVGANKPVQSINKAISMAGAGDTIVVQKGVYREGNILVNKPLTLLGMNYPEIDGQKKHEVVSIKSDHVVFKGFKIIRSGHSSLDDPGGIKVYNVKFVQILDNELEDNFFGIYIQYGNHCVVKNNRIKASAINEQETGNGIHC
jgi:nitrous oxidase accessory protein